jgi:hypothetical protein
MAFRTISRSNGLSSRNTIESIPMFSVSWIWRMLSTLLSQLATKTAKSSSRRTISGCDLKGSAATASSFLLQTARITPRSLSFLIHSCSSV